jgi:AbrB family looped-hinge helix DNA binding protein
MRITVSSKGQVVLPAEVRRRLRLVQGERLSVEVRGDSVILRPLPEPRRYQAARHPRSGLPVMVALKPPKRKVTAADIARLHADLL